MFRAIWRSFDTPTVNRVTAKVYFVCGPTPLQSGPITHPNPLHALGRSITIVWAKTSPHLESPSSVYLYIGPLPQNLRMNPPLTLVFFLLAPPDMSVSRRTRPPPLPTTPAPPRHRRRPTRRQGPTGLAAWDDGGDRWHEGSGCGRRRGRVRRLADTFGG